MTRGSEHPVEVHAFASAALESVQGPSAPVPDVPGPDSLRRRVLHLAAGLFPRLTARLLARRFLSSTSFVDRAKIAASPDITLVELGTGGAVLRHAAPDPTRPYARVLLAHGHDGHPRQFARILKALRVRNAAVDVLVLPGHLDQQPEICGVDRIVGAIGAALDLFGPYDSVATHCVSGNGLLHCLDEGRDVGSVALISASLDLPHLVRTSGVQYGLKGKTLDHFIASVGSLGAPYPLNTPWHHIATRRGEPLMVIHAKADWAAPVENAEELGKLWPNADIRIFDRGDHNTILSVSPAVTAVAEFLSMIPL
ncbi:alpha/beta fold hydrolase [Nioella aestuarii]|uniref:alpha/beta fold hydrolase n=1 Tax=Nioella aestuarii TaxID=1662864 RepID=UPI003D7F2106